VKDDSMSDTIAILSHVERLWPVYTQDRIHLSVNLTVALTGSVDADDLHRLAPWTWTIDEFVVLGANYDPKGDPKGVLRRDSMATVAAKKEMLPDAVQPAQGQITHWQSALEAVRDDFQHTTTDAFVCDWLMQKQKPEAESSDRRRWYAFLLHVATFPTPLPQVANLSWIISVAHNDLYDSAETPRFDRLFVALTFNFKNDQTKRFPLLPDAGGTGGPVQLPGQDYSEWTYGPDTAVPRVAAYQKPCDPNDPGPRVILDGKTGWVQFPNGTAYAEDWTTQLEQRAADAFDAPQHLLAAVRQVTLSPQQTTAVQRAGLVTLRDAAGTGWRRAPDGSCVGDSVVDAVKVSDAWLKSHNVTIDGLRDLVRARLEESDHALTPDRWTQYLDAAQAANPPARGEEPLAQLERLHGLLRTPSFLATVFLAQWRDALSSATSAVVTAFWTDHQAAISSFILGEPPVIALRRRLSLEQVGLVWEKLTRIAGTDEIAALKGNLRAVTGAYIRTRLRLAVPPADQLADDCFPKPPAADDPLLAALFDDRIAPHLDTFCATFADAQLLPTAKAPADLNITAVVPDEVAIPIDRLASVEDSDDALRRISGYGVLLHAKTDTSWHCLNHASIRPRSSGAAVIVDSTVVPIRAQYRNGTMRQAFASYNNQPLVADSPALGFSSRMMVPPSADPALFGLLFGNVYKQGGRTLPALSFGGDYEAAVFAFGPAGNVPLGIADGDPRVLKDGVVPDDAPKLQISYRRRVPIGPVRVEPFPAGARKAFQEMDSLDLPKIPDTVRPRARSRVPHEADFEKSLGRPEPLLLLAPPGKRTTTRLVPTTYTFSVRPPAADINVYDRWANKSTSPATVDLRKQIWREFHRAADGSDQPSTDGSIGGKQAAIDLSIDDPAVSKLVVRLTRLEGPGSDPPGKPVVPASQSGSRLEPVQRQAVRVEITATGPSVDPRLDIAADKVVVTVPEGSIYRLDVLPVVAAADKDRFSEKAVWSLAKPASEPALTDSVTFPGFSLLIEVATDTMPSARDLHGALVLSPLDGHVGWKAELKPDPPLDWIHRVEVLVQRWRWQGRPLTFAPQGFDFTAFAAAPESSDGVLFGDRESNDHLVHESSVDFIAGRAGGVPLRAEVMRMDVAREPGALYFRVAARAFSRYEGIFDRSIDSRTAGANAASEAGESWQRIVLRSRFKGDLPPPFLKLVVPLTDGCRPPGRTPGVLIVLNEAWFQHGGLAEDFETDLITTWWPDASDMTQLFEFGPDPILSAEAVAAGTTVALPRAVGPIGYTFDTDTSAPLFVHSSFIVYPPETVQLGTRTTSDLGWCFAKVRFRRTISPASMVDPPERARVSPYTQPVWVQFLSPSSRYRWKRRGSTTQEGSLLETSRLSVLRDGAVWQLVGSDVGPAVPVALMAVSVDPSSVAEMLLFALVTERLADATGRLTQERYAGLFQVDQTGTLQKVDGADVDTVAPEQRRIRILEVQRRKGEESDPFSLTALFGSSPTATPKDATARVVRVSNPIGESD
jgi:hypothetical protein